MLSSITKWATDAYTDWTKTSSSGQNFAGFLSDPLGSVTNFMGKKAVDWAKQSLSERMARYDQNAPGQPQVKYTSAGAASSSVPSYGKFTSQQAQVPGMRVPQIRNAFDNLYNNSDLLKVPNVRLTVEYTRPNLKASGGTLSLGSSNISKQKVKTTTKSALSRT